MATQSSIIWNYFTKISTGKDSPVAASCNTCNNSMESDPETNRLSTHLRVHHKPLHNELEEVMRNLGKSPSGRGLSLVNENVPAAPKTSVLRNFRMCKKPAVKPVMAVRPTKVKAPDSPESGKVRLKSLFESLLRQARKADGGEPPENNTAGITENAVGQLINNLISGTVDTDTFHKDLQKVLNSQPQPALVPFINENLQPLKISMRSGELSISGLSESKAARPVMAVRPMKAVAKQRAVKPMRAPYALRNLKVSSPKPRIIATPCSISQKSRKEKTKKGSSNKFEGVCLLALTGTHDCSVDHDNENVPPQEQTAKQNNEDAKPRSLRDFRMNRNQSKGTS